MATYLQHNKSRPNNFSLNYQIHPLLRLFLISHVYSSRSGAKARLNFDLMHFYHQ